MKLLNIGCGSVFHPDWINIDMVARSNQVREYDLRRGIPYPVSSMDACYSSHVLEHLRPVEAEGFLGEQRRVLKPGGVVRVVVPDLEPICRNYLELVQTLAAGDLQHEFRYDYTLLELFDQIVRERSGGETEALWKSGRLIDREWVLARAGNEFEAAVAQHAVLAAERTGPLRQRIGRKFARVARLSPRRAVRRIGSLIQMCSAFAMVRVFFGKGTANSLREGLFRNSGEIHRVMYDRFRLARLLKTCGFSEPRVCGPNESRIPNFASFELDAQQGQPRKPDSLYMEAIKAANG